jgi:hypothetical protein
MDPHRRVAIYGHLVQAVHLTEDGFDPLAGLRQRGIRSFAFLAAPVLPLGSRQTHMASLRPTYMQRNGGIAGAMLVLSGCPVQRYLRSGLKSVGYSVLQEVPCMGRGGVYSYVEHITAERMSILMRKE